MRPARRAEIGIDAQVDFHRAQLKSAAATRCKVRRLSHLRYVEHAAIEGACLGFTAGGHRELHVLDAFDQHGVGRNADFWPPHRSLSNPR